MDLAQLRMTSPFGEIFLVASGEGLCSIHFKKQRIKMAQELRAKDPQLKFLKAAEKELTNYFLGKAKHFKLKLDLQGTEFQKLVWSELSKIPYGQTISYKELAQKIKKPLAVRAVGSANGKNPLCIIVPCHRVIASSGAIGGYSGGLKMKRTLLALEKAYHF